MPSNIVNKNVLKKLLYLAFHTLMVSKAGLLCKLLLLEEVRSVGRDASLSLQNNYCHQSMTVSSILVKSLGLARIVMGGVLKAMELVQSISPEWLRWQSWAPQPQQHHAAMPLQTPWFPSSCRTLVLSVTASGKDPPHQTNANASTKTHAISTYLSSTSARVLLAFSWVSLER